MNPYNEVILSNKRRNTETNNNKSKDMLSERNPPYKEQIQHDSIYTKVRNRQKYSMVTKSGSTVAMWPRLQGAQEPGGNNLM